MFICRNSKNYSKNAKPSFELPIIGLPLENTQNKDSTSEKFLNSNSSDEEIKEVIIRRKASKGGEGTKSWSTFKGNETALRDMEEEF
jgi:hypothetical protein